MPSTEMKEELDATGVSSDCIEPAGAVRAPADSLGRRTR